MTEGVAPIESNDTRQNLIVFDFVPGGHRRSYVAVLSDELHGKGVFGWRPGIFRHLLKAKRVIFPTLDGTYLDIFRMLVIIILRGLLGRYTLSISHGAVKIFQRGFHPKTMWWLLMTSFIKHWPQSSVVSVTPYWVEPRLKKYTNDWIYDVQFWDLRGERLPTHGMVKDRIGLFRSKAGQRLVLLGIGRQSQRKGSDFMMRLYNSCPDLRTRFLFVICGAFHGDMGDLRANFETAGGICFDRDLSDDELLDCYEEADLIWACYPPSHNQSSGIFGRALQFGRPVVVREGSYLESLMRELGEGVAIPNDNFREAAAKLQQFANRPVGPTKTDQWKSMRTKTIETLRGLLELE